MRWEVAAILTPKETHQLEAKIVKRRGVGNPLVGCIPARDKHLLPCQCALPKPYPWSVGPAEQAAATVNRHRKRTLSEARVTDARLGLEEEQHSFQSAFQQYRAQSHSQHAPSVGGPPPVSSSEAMQLLLKAAAQSNTDTFAPYSGQQPSESDRPGTNSISMSHAPRDYPSMAAGGDALRLPPQHSRTHYTQTDYAEQQQPAHVMRPTSQMPQPSQHSAFRPSPSPELSYAHLLSPLYTPLTPKPKIQRQLISALRMLEHPEMDADAVQAALEFAAALEIGAGTAALPRQHQHLPASHHTTESIKLLQAIEISAERLDVLRLLTCRLATCSIPGEEGDISMLSQLLLVIQDLMRDMESNQRLLQQAGAVLRSHKSAAAQQVSSSAHTCGPCTEPITVLHVIHPCSDLMLHFHCLG